MVRFFASLQRPGATALCGHRAERARARGHRHTVSHARQWAWARGPGDALSRAIRHDALGSPTRSRLTASRTQIPRGGTVTTTLDYTTALSAAHDDAAASLQRSREQLEELLRTLDQQRAEITDELERVQGALAALSAAVSAAAPPAATPIRAPARPRGRAKAGAQSRPPRPGTNAYRVAEVFAHLGTANAKTAQERTGVDSGSVHHIIRRLVDLEWIKPGTREGRAQSYDWSGPALGAT
jgi:hypothetical protein